MTNVGLIFFVIFFSKIFGEPLHFYKDLSCVLKEGSNFEYVCPDFSTGNETCRFKDKILQKGQTVDDSELKGSCTPSCSCGYGGILHCAHSDCFERIKLNCSHFKFSLDRCCPIDSVCGDSKIECEIEGVKHKLGQKIYVKETCEVCVCDEEFKKEAPFCKPRKCNDQALRYDYVSNYGAPVFFKDEKCCPDIWIRDEDQIIVDLSKFGGNSEQTVVGPNVNGSEQGTCRFGKREVKLGFGFNTKVDPYGRIIPIKCGCTHPPLLICHEIVV